MPRMDIDLLRKRGGPGAGIAGAAISLGWAGGRRSPSRRRSSYFETARETNGARNSGHTATHLDRLGQVEIVGRARHHRLMDLLILLGSAKIGRASCRERLWLRE